MGFKRPIVWTYHPMMLQTLGLLKPSKLVYHCVDDLSAVHGIDPQQIRHLEEQLIRKSDAVFTTSTNLQSMVEEICQGKGHYYPNVADIEHFEQARAPQVDEPKDLQGILHPRIVYVGVLTDYKIDFQLLKGLAEARPNWQWILIGEEREGQNDPTLAQLSQRGNVHLLGHRAYKDLPQFLASCDVAILPTHINQYTQSMFPMKFFEYLAAGLPVVSTNLPSLAPYQAFFKSSQNPQEFLNNLEEVLNSDPAPIPTQELSPFSWKTRLKHQLKALEPQQ